MTKTGIIPSIIQEHKKAKKSSFPDHVVAQTAMIGKEFGVLQSAAIGFKYEREQDPVLMEMQKAEIKKAALKTAVACIRFLEEFNQ